MMTVTDLQLAILGPSKAEYTQLIRWLREQDWECWEQEFDEVAGLWQVGTEGSRC